MLALLEAEIFLMFLIFLIIVSLIVLKIAKILIPKGPKTKLCIQFHIKWKLIVLIMKIVFQMWVGTHELKETNLLFRSSTRNARIK